MSKIDILHKTCLFLVKRLGDFYMAEKMDRRVRKTKAQLREGLARLMQKKSIKEISVKELVDEVDINRSTFYLHYETMDDLLQESLSYLFSKFKMKYDSSAQVKVDSDSLGNLYLITPEYIIPYLEFLYENKQIFMTAIKKPAIFEVSKHYDEMYSGIFNPILERFGVEPGERKYILTYHISGMHAIIIEWVKNGCKESAQYIADLLIKYTLPYKEPDGV